MRGARLQKGAESIYKFTRIDSNIIHYPFKALGFRELVLRTVFE